MHTILDNAKRFAQRESERLPCGLSRDEVFDLLHRRAGENRRLMGETNRVIRESLRPVLDHPFGLTDGEADVFAEFAQELYTLSRSIDIGLAFPLHEALLKRARARGDRGRILRHLYWLGMIQMQWDARMFVGEAIDSFEEAAAYRREYFTFADRETRLLINKCVGNRYVALSGMRTVDPEGAYEPFMRAIDEARAFWSDPAVRALDPDFPWDAFMLNSHQNICAWSDRLRSTHRRDKRLAKRVYDSVQAMYGKENEFYHTARHLWPNGRTASLVLISQYHMGMIGERTLIGALMSMFDEVAPDDYSRDGMYAMLHTSLVAVTYMEHSETMPDDERRARLQSMMRRILAYCQGVPGGLDRQSVNSFLSAFAVAVASPDLWDEQSYIRTVLRLTTFSHLPTYVHSVMVGALMRLLAEYFIDRDPSLLVGMRGTATAAEVLGRREEILDEIRLAGLCHDAGKIAYVNTVALCSRSINDREFALIKEHTRVGHRMFTEGRVGGCIPDVILGHHKWYDGGYGYPPEFDNTRSPYKFIIDIASAADSIDAATDSVGRSYAPGHTLPFVVDEIIEQAGVRYSPVVAEALKDASLIEQIRAVITDGRKQAYYDAYRDINAR